MSENDLKDKNQFKINLKSYQTTTTTTEKFNESANFLMSTNKFKLIDQSCALCSLNNETNLLSQGNLKQYKSTIHFNQNNLQNLKNFLSNNNSNQEISILKTTKNSKIKTALLLKLGLKTIPQIIFNEINKIGWLMDNLKSTDVFDLSADCFFVHFNCYIWSYGILFNNTNNILDENSTPLNLDKIVFESLTKKCSLCNLYGASLKCSIADCNETYHYPCSSLSGCYLNLNTHQILCVNHSNQANFYFNNKCILCDSSDRINEQLYCTSCGFYYHSNCLSPPIEINPLIRIGWQCPECKICQACRKLGDDNKMLVCDTCDKCYHSYCLKNDFILNKTTNTWKCDFCKKELSLTRACLNCKSLVLKDSLECLCESCNELKKNLSIQETKKRSVKDLLQLSLISNLTTSPEQKSLIKKEPDNLNLKDSSKLNEQLTNIKIESTDNQIKPPASTQTTTIVNKPQICTKKKQIPKKNNRNMKRTAQSASSNQLSSVNTRGTRSRQSGKDPKNENSSKKNPSDNSNEESESSKKKTQNDEATIGHIKRDEDDHHAVTVISSLEDSFTLRQDMCLSCGSFGKGEDGQIISCCQCGQSFHNYCAGLNQVSDTILQKGWRCLDCTVCEGCGKATDEGRLLLCDDCDISYHIYCLEPPLDQVPKGNWKCKWCVKCTKCGSKKPGKNLEWKNNYSECAYCYSLSECHLCCMNYNENDIIGKCTKCERWSHISCKNNKLNDEELENKYMYQNFICLKCNEVEKHDTLSQNKKQLSHKLKNKNSKLEDDNQNDLSFLDELANLSRRCNVDEGVYLTDLGSELIKKLKIKPLPCARRNRVLKSTNTNPDSDTNLPKIEKMIDDNSRSSSEDKAESLFNEDNLMEMDNAVINNQVLENNNNQNELRLNEINNKKSTNLNPPKRHVNIGLGGFYLKTRNRPKPQQSIDQNDPNVQNENENNKTINKRKKKITYEDMIPTYMQEAFFGQNTLATCKDANVNFDEPIDCVKLEKKHDKDMHRINLDENMLKLAQQNKKGHLELGIEDFLDGDIVSYLFNENRNLMEFNPEQDITNTNPTSNNTNSSSNKTRLKDNYDEKIFDEKIYEDLLHQIVSENPKNSNSVDEYLNLNHHANIPESLSFDNNNLLNKETNNLVTTTSSSNSNSLQSANDNRNIDDLARQFKESTHKYATQISSNNNINTNTNNENENHLKDNSFNSTHQNLPDQNNLVTRNQPDFPLIDPNFMSINCPIPLDQNQKMDVSKPIVSNQQFNLILTTKIDNNNQQNLIQFPQQQQQQQSQQNNKNKFLSSAFINENSLQEQMIQPQQHKLNDSSNTDQQHISFDDPEISNDCFNPPSQPGGTKTASKDDLSKHQKMLEKYAEDEDLGELATQAMSLYSNINYPNLRNEIKDLSERYRYIHKIWRKLDSQIKLNYINKSRQNRYKKKSDEKGTVKQSKRCKSPSANSDKQSDAENFSRSATPSISLDDTNDTSQHTSQLIKQNIEEQNQLKIQSNNNEKQDFIFDKNMQTIAVLNPQTNILNPVQIQLSSGLVNNNQQQQHQQTNQILLYQLQQQQIQQQQHHQPTQIQNKSNDQPTSISTQIIYNHPIDNKQILNQHLQQQQLQQQQMQQNKQEKITVKAYLNNQVPALSSSMASSSSSNTNQSVSIENMINMNKNYSNNQITEQKPHFHNQKQNITIYPNQDIKFIENQKHDTILIKPEMLINSNQIQLQTLIPNVLKDDKMNENSNKNEEISDHIDNIINEVVAGSGTIPYDTDFDDEETSSSFKEFLQSQSEKIEYSNHSNTSFDNKATSKPTKSKKASNKSQDDSNKQTKKRKNQQQQQQQTMKPDDFINQEHIDSSNKHSLFNQNQPPANRNILTTGSATKINEILMINQNYQTQQQTNNNNNNFYLIPTSSSIPNQSNTIDQSNNNNNKILCKDDNLKKILSLPENNLLIDNNNLNLNNFSGQDYMKKNLIVKNIINEHQTQPQQQLHQQQQQQQQIFQYHNHSQPIQTNFKLITQTANPTQNQTNQMEKFLQLDGQNDDLINDDLKLNQNYKLVSVNPALLNIEQQQQQNIQLINNQQLIQTNNSNSTNKQDSHYNSKLNSTKVVINHELLNSYGITLNPTSQHDEKQKNLKIQQQNQFNINNNQPFDPISSQPQASTPQPQTYPVVLATNQPQNQFIYQPQAQLKVPSKTDSESNFNNLVPDINYNALNQNFVPKVNGDNTLLKALLQTAPKNVAQNQNQQQPIQQTQTQLIEQQQQQQKQTKIKIESNNQTTDIKEVNKKLKSSDQTKKSKSTNQTQQTTVQNTKVQTKLLADLKTKIIESSTLSTAASNLSQENSDQTDSGTKSNPRKRKNIKLLNNNQNQNENSNEIVLNKLLDDLKTMGSLYMTQPRIDFNYLSIDYPEKKHLLKIKNSSNLKLSGDLFNLNIEFGQNESNGHSLVNYFQYLISDSTCLNSHLKHNFPNKFNKKLLQQSFKICTSNLDEPIKTDKINRDLIDNSTKRLHDVLDGNVEIEKYEQGEDEDEIDLNFKRNQLLKYDIKKESIDHPSDSVASYSDVLSPILDIEPTNQSTGNQENQYKESMNNKNKIKAVFKLSTKAASNIRETVLALADLLSIKTPTVWDLGKLITHSNQIKDLDKQQQQNDMIKLKKNPQSNMKIFNNNNNNSINLLTETLYSLQNLSSLYSVCKFCESFIMNDSNDFEHQLVENNMTKENMIRFCSEYCKLSYQKLLKIKKMNQIKSIQQQEQQKLTDTNNQVINRNLNLNKSGKTILKWSPSILANITNNSEQNQNRSDNKFEPFKTSNYVDKRTCIFCKLSGDQEPNGPCRLLTVDVDTWSHLNCALWSDEVYETMNGALINVDLAYKKCVNVQCCYCHQKGASLRCFSTKCNCYYHLPCAIKDKCAFNQDKTIFCSTHSVKALSENRLTNLSVHRSVWIQRDEVAQIQSFMSRDFDENHYAIRIGSLILHNIGQLLPHQLSSGSFNTRDYIYPIGYKATRIYWSINRCFKRCRYFCSIIENDGNPEFSITIIEENNEKETMIDKSPTLLWKKILERIESMRRENDLVKLFPVYFSGEYMFGLTEPHIIRLVESLPGVETLTDYAFKFGRLQLLDMPLAINPTGCARSEPKLRTHFRKSRTLTCNTTNTITQRSDSNGSNGGGNNGSSSNEVYSTVTYYDQDDDDLDDEDEYLSNKNSDLDIGLVSYTKQFTLSKSTQFKKLKSEWRSNVYLAKSKIQGLGLYAARDLEKNSMIIEYIGELIRNEVANRREKLYESQNRGIYMFRLNDELVVDATISGGLARYINHCCDPNCIAETVTLEKDQKIIIIANKKILKGEELTYDYQFEFEDESNKIQCLCGSANCKKWMN